tara:strand:- start:176 stop:322 length:147 start_codon:yes stop_codon:yes gene_type:complete
MQVYISSYGYSPVVKMKVVKETFAGHMGGIFERPPPQLFEPPSNRNGN